MTTPTILGEGMEASGPRPTRVRYDVLAVGCTFALLTYIHRQAFVGATPEIQTALGLSKSQIGNITAVFLLAYGIFQMPCGFIGDRLGARHLLTILVIGSSLATAAVALAGLLPPGGVAAFVFLLVVRFVFGGFQAGAFPVWARVMTDWMLVPERAIGQGLVWMFSRMGGALSPFLVMWLIQLSGTWTTPLWVLGAMGIVWSAAFWTWFRNRPEQVPSVNAAELELIERGRAAAIERPKSIPWAMLFSSLNVWGLCLMYGCVGFAGNFITNLLPIYLKDERGLSPDLTKILTGLPLAFGVVSCVLGGVVSDLVARHWGNRKWGRRLNGSVGLVLAGLGIVVVPWVEPTWLLAVLFCASFFCNDLNIAPAWAACADVGERYAGTISGAMNMIGQFGGAIGMSLAGYMLELGYSKPLFIAFGCSYALAALCWLAIDVTRPSPWAKSVSAEQVADR